VSNINHLSRFETPRRTCRAIAFTLATLVATVSYAQVPEPLGSLIAFNKATQDYVLMHRRLERQIGSIEFGTPVAEINRIINGLAAAIRAERADAGQGDLFTPPLSRLLRARIQDALSEHHYSVDDARVSSRVDGVDYTRVKLQVNDTFPWILGAAMLPCLIEVLPPLPPELQYRMVDDLLVLIDVHASLVVDILPHALADLTAQNVRPQGGLR
jgi:hypothetical protein